MIEGDYLGELLELQREELARVNNAGLAALRSYLGSGDAVAFLGAGVSVPLYPLWNGLIGELVDAAADRLTGPQAVTCRALASSSPEEVVEIVRRNLGTAAYREVLREVLRARIDPASGRSWTPTQELVCRCAFKGVVTTNYDPGIVDARMRVRPGAAATGFTTWDDELGLDRWRTAQVFGDVELPVLYAHGQYNRPDSVVLATAEYRRAYEGKLAKVLERLVDGGHLVWIGFSFADQRITAILREVAHWSGTRGDPGAAPEHVAIMPWDPGDSANDPGILAQRAEISYGARVVLYPAPDGDHSALPVLLEALADPRFPPAGELPARPSAPVNTTALTASPDAGPLPVTWVPEPEPVEYFTARVEELARLDRWAADPQVALVGVTAWGGAGKTALVSHWTQAGGAPWRPGLRGVFGWNFYADPSADHWADSLLSWARQQFGIPEISFDRPAAAVLGLLRAVPLLLALDGLEVMQEGPAGDEFGRLLDGTLREVLGGVCQLHHGGLVVLTSRFPFADLETFDGSSARMVEVPPFTPGEGSALLAAAGGDWLPEGERRALVQAVDGHALAIGVLAAVLGNHPPASDLAALQDELAAAARTDARVGRVLRFYADRLSEPDRYLLAAVSMFSRPVPAAAVLTIAEHEAFAGQLEGWTPAMVETAVRDRLEGLASWHPDATLSAHPLVRDAFRPLAMEAAEIAADIGLIGLPAGEVTSRDDGRRVVEAIELLLEADQWEAADNLYERRTDNSMTWTRLPAARLGQRCASAFVGTPSRQDTCRERLGSKTWGFYLACVGLHAMSAGDLGTAQEYLRASIRQDRDDHDMYNLVRSLQNLGNCLARVGKIGSAQKAVAEAIAISEEIDETSEIGDSHALMGWLEALTGHPTIAEEQFIEADRSQFAQYSSHQSSINGVKWAEWLLHTGRHGPARSLIGTNLEISQKYHYNADVARFNELLGRLALHEGDNVTAERHLAAAAEGFRAGDYLTDLAETLPHLAEHARVTGDLTAAERHLTEAITIAGPRELAPAQSAALAARARIRADQVLGTKDSDLAAQGWDAAAAALRLATHHRLAWHELDALRAHAALDQAEGADHGWAAQADALHARLVPPGLDPDPLATVERLVAAQKPQN